MLLPNFLKLLLLLIIPASLSAATVATDLALMIRDASGVHQLYTAGDAIRLEVEVINQGTERADSIYLSATLPQGLSLADQFWQSAGGSVFRMLSEIEAGETIRLSLWLKVEESVKSGRLALFIQLTSVGGITGQPDSDSSPGNGIPGGALHEDDEQLLYIEIAELLATRIDTCLVINDSTENTVRTLVASRTSVLTRLRSPIDLSPTGPILLSHKKCAAFELKPVKKKKKKKKKKKRDKCSCFVYHFAGDTVTNYPDPYEVDGRRMMHCDTLLSAGQAGDTISISVTSVDGKPLKKIMLKDGKNEVLDAQFDSPSFTFEQILEHDTAKFKLYLQANKKCIIFPPNQLAFIKVSRKPAAVRRYRKTIPSPSLAGTAKQQAMLKDSCPEGFVLETVNQLQKRKIWVAVDTLMSQSTAASLSLVGQRNPSGRRSGVFDIAIPLHLKDADLTGKDSLIGFAYWIGIGSTSIAAYEALLESVPPEWAQPGVSLPLAAFGQSRPLLLPALEPGEAIFQKDFVRYDFLDARGKERFLTGKKATPLISRNAGRPNYGIVSGDALRALFKTSTTDEQLGRKVLRFYLPLENNHQVNTYVVQLKIVAYYQLSEPLLVWQTVVNPPKP